MIAAFRTVFPDIPWVIEETRTCLAASRNMALIAANSSASAANVQARNMKDMVVDLVVAGKMVGSRILMDGLGITTQLAVIPAEKAAT